jgi:hypothetical protein
LKSLGHSLLLSLVSIVFALLFMEWVAGMFVATPAARIAASGGIDFDTRSRLDVVLDCRKSGQSCYPAVPPNTFLENKLELNGDRIIPLSSVPQARIIACNEAGFYSTYMTDEYGFRNPENIWQGADIVDLAFVGDSYTQGDCVNDGDHFIDPLRAMYPKVLNLGAGGNGPLLELASVKEYLQDRQVRYLFWVFFERNDLSDLSNRKNSNLLLNYLKSGFSQSLMHRQRDVNNAVRDYVEGRLTEKDQGRALILPNIRLLIWKFRQGNLLTSWSRKNSPGQAPVHDIELFRQVLTEAKRIITAQGGRFVFIYLPEYERFVADKQSPPWSAARIKAEILDMVATLEIDTIDIEKAFRREADPLELFPFKIQGHYNSKGYAVVANEIMQYLEHQQAGSTAVNSQAHR